MIVIKRGLLILLLLISLVPFVLAENGCCAEAVNNAGLCVYTTEENCATPDFFNPGQQCADTSFCEVGCCEKPDGLCADGSGEYACTAIGGDWTAGSCEEITQCDSVCCTFGNSYAYGTVAYCEDQFGAYETDSDSIEYHSVGSYEECADIGRAEDLGCCVSEDNLCSYTTGGECTLDVDPETGYGFYEGEFCSDIAGVLADGGYEAAGMCEAEAEASSGCLNEDIQFYDSYGNPEHIVECDYPDYACSAESGEGVCISTVCQDTFAFDDSYFSQFNSYTVYYDDSVDATDFVTMELGNSRQSGESWCVYEGPVGGFQDRVGTQHYRATCVDGEESIYSCDSSRGEVCVVTRDRDTHQFNSECVQNNYDLFYKESDYAEQDSLGNLDYTSEALAWEDTDGITRYGVSTVPTATNFWDGELETFCPTAAIDCTVWYGDVIGDETTSGWEPYINTFCNRPEFGLTAIDYCSSRGDCGVKPNILGEYGSNDGLQITADPPEVGIAAMPGEDRDLIVGVGGVDEGFDYGSCADPQWEREGGWLAFYYTYVQQAQDYYWLTADKSEEVYNCEFYDINDHDATYQGYVDSVSQNVIVDQYSREYLSSKWLDTYTLARRSSAFIPGTTEGKVLFGDDLPLASDVCLDADERFEHVSDGLGFNVPASVGDYGSDATTFWFKTYFDLDPYSSGEAFYDNIRTYWFDNEQSYVDYNSATLADQEIEAYVADQNNFNEIFGKFIAREDGVLLYNQLVSIKPWYIDPSAVTVEGLEGNQDEPENYLSYYAGDDVCGYSDNEWTRTGDNSAGNGRAASVVSYQCSAWENDAAIDSKCHLCDETSDNGGLVLTNGDKIYEGTACTQWRCHSLGSCTWLGEENDPVNAIYDSTKPSCVEDVTCTGEHPVLAYYEISDQEVLSNAIVDEGNSNGYEITNIPFGESFTFGVETSEYSECKFFTLDELGGDIDAYVDSIIDSSDDIDAPDEIYDSLTGDYLPSDEEGTNDVGLSLYHKANWRVDEEGEQKVVVWCQNTCNINNLNPFVISLEATEEPDTTAPEIKYVDPLDETLVSADTTEVSLTVALSEASVCRYSFDATNVYEDHDFEFAACDAEGFPSELSFYECTTPIEITESTTSLHFQCEDTEGNQQVESTSWTVYRSEVLEISQLSPEGDVYTSDVTLQVFTDGGMSGDGSDTTCSYKEEGRSYYVDMFSSGNYHYQEGLTLSEDDYVYDIRCVDDIGNEIETTIEFSVKVDRDAAEIAQVYYLEPTMYIITNEDATCEYATESFSFGSGQETAGSGSTDHSFTVEDVSATYHVICEDIFGNEMGEVQVDLSYLS